MPFCAQRCTYCDFYFVTTEKSHTGFVEAVCTEIRLRAQQYAHLEPVESLYFGGGTPSRLSSGDLGRIIETLNDHFDLSNVRETTIEVNPEDVNPAYLAAIRALGIDRLSIGIQSFFQDDLAFMNRIHDAGTARSVVEWARAGGFDNFSIDLIFGLPEQPPEYWSANLEIACSLDVPHISTYGLTIEDGTPLFNRVERGLISPMEEEDMSDQFQFTMGYLRDRGYEHYEISSFAREGSRAIHNHRYWNHENYLGFGPSAHSFWWSGLPAQRWANVRNLKRYEALLRQHVAPVDESEQLAIDLLADEYVMLRLRTADGLDLDELESRYGVDLLLERVDEFAELESSGFIRPIRNEKIRLTDLGKTVCDTVTARLLPG
ncbi:MAG: radical SAM family heme chaperone HemW [Bacteroidota bacterium]|nr:radical SAM family heme chaperone HemW [Bacteroidota bacterium]